MNKSLIGIYLSLCRISVRYIEHMTILASYEVIRLIDEYILVLY